MVFNRLGMTRLKKAFAKPKNEKTKKELEDALIQFSNNLRKLQLELNKKAKNTNELYAINGKILKISETVLHKMLVKTKLHQSIFKLFHEKRPKTRNEFIELVAKENNISFSKASVEIESFFNQLKKDFDYIHSISGKYFTSETDFVGHFFNGGLNLYSAELFFYKILK